MHIGLLALLLALAGCSDPASPAPEPCRGPKPTKGPWAIKMTQKSIRLRWETRQAGCVEVGYAPLDGSAEEVWATGTSTPFEVTQGWPIANPPDETGTFHTATVDLTGLRPGTCYRYTVHAEGEPHARFCTSRPSGERVRFLAIGDTNPVLGHTAPLLARLLPKGFDFTLHLGDLQYYSAVAESWQLWFERMQLLLGAGAFLPTIGNHENEESVPGEMAQYYLRFFGGAGDLGHDHLYHFESGGVHFFSLNTEDKAGLMEGGAQRNLLAGLLESAKSSPGFRFSVISMHRPLYTLAGDNGGTPTTHARELRGSLQPLFAAHGVKLVLAGHVHSYERFDVDGVPYVVSGGGGAILTANMDAGTDEFPDDVPLRKAAARAYHAVLVDVTPGEASLAAIDGDGATVDAHTWPVP